MKFQEVVETIDAMSKLSNDLSTMLDSHLSKIVHVGDVGYDVQSGTNQLKDSIEKFVEEVEAIKVSYMLDTFSKAIERDPQGVYDFLQEHLK